MLDKKLSVLAVIPARGGSKSIPGKNLCKITGNSLVSITALLVNKLTFVDAKIISTDDSEIAEEAKKYGIEVPFFRSKVLSNDEASSIDMWRDAWLRSEIYFKRKFDISILLEPTSPLRTVDDINKTVTTLINEKVGCVVTVSKTPAHFTPHKTLVLSENNDVTFYLEKGSQYSLRQRIPQYYHRNGICYAVTREHLLDKCLMLEENTKALIIDRNVVNIDDPFDLELARWIFTKDEII
jgi:CMP-N,N'-diacetyllegionaminic acid synthase